MGLPLPDQLLKDPTSILHTSVPVQLQSLSEILCLRHSMTYRSIYAKQEEAGGSRHDGVAVD
ncbi:MAG: hypothetical protein ACLGG8_11310, partial [Gammaproteobacteria bacterium]